MPEINAQELRNQIEAILRVWTANPEFKLKDVTLQQFTAEAKRFEALLTDLAKKEAELTPLRNSRDELTATLVNLTVRARAAVKGYFGGNSTEYELVGGTRTAARKKNAARKPAPADARAAA